MDKETLVEEMFYDYWCGPSKNNIKYTKEIHDLALKIFKMGFHKGANYILDKHDARIKRVERKHGNS